MEFHNKEYFYLFILLILALYIIINYRKHISTIIFSNIELFKGSRNFRTRFFMLPGILRIIALVFIILALARPQLPYTYEEVNSEGVDIILCLDVSTSMKAEDFKPNRLQAAKKTIKEFISGRKTDRIGLVIFAQNAFVKSPLTTDYSTLLDFVDSINFGELADGTAIGSGIAISVMRLKKSIAKSKVIILLTDGVNNSGYIQPTTAAQIAKTFNIKIYTIGMGRKGPVPYPVYDKVFGKYYTQNVEIQVDDDLLRQIAKITNAQYFSASSNKKLKEVYKLIDNMEKTEYKIKTYKRYKEEFQKFLNIAILLLLIEYLLRRTIFFKAP